MKRVLSVILTALIILPVVLTGSVVFMPDSGNGSAFSLYANAINAALGSIDDVEDLGESSVLPQEDRYIVKFYENTAATQIEKALKGTDHLQLGQDGFLYAVSGDGFLNRNDEIIEYYEKDQTRTTFAAVNDPAVFADYASMGVYNAWDRVTGSKDVIVAVLDTGVSRNHEDLSGVNILAGYDAVARKAGVYEDTEGHGTGIIGLIAATADNGLGVAGVAHGVSILPIKVAANGTTIYSSDLVRGIRFAADAGAKIINMSIGGYSSSVAEQEAINYALSKGCIIIAAAGNGGMSDYAHQNSYPASYEGVISVASCNSDGERSLFSQYNSMVDIAAYGESVPMPIVDESGASVYRIDSGTSYSCAFVSGIAALAASRIGNDIRFEGDEFLALITDTCGIRHSDELGYGVINAEKIINIANQPIITGVANGKTYYESVKIGFNRGTATLDDGVFEDGEAVMANGSHVLTVKDGGIEKTIKFRLDYTPLSFDFKEFSSYCYFEFERGSALLDGFPYRSGEKITASGYHEFILSDGDETLTKTINLKYALPSVYGIEDGKTYNTPVEIRIVGEGNAFLDGVEIFGEAVVCEKGGHSLTVKSGNGAISKDYYFTLDFDLAQVFENDYSDGKAAIDEENGFACLYGDSLVGVRIYDIDSMNKYLHFLPVGRVYSHIFKGNELWLFGDEGITVLNRSLALSGSNGIVKTVKPEGVGAFVFAEENVFCFGNGNMYSIDPNTESLTLVTELGFDCTVSFYDNNRFYLLSPENDNILRIFDITTFGITEFDLGIPVIGTEICYGEGYIAIGNKLFDTADGSPVLQFASIKAIKIENGLLFTEKRIVDIATAKELASLPFAASDIVHGKNNTYIFGSVPYYAIISDGATGYAAYGAAARVEKMFSAPVRINPYRLSAFYDNYSHLVSAATATTTLFAVFKNSNSLYRIDTSTGNEISSYPLLYSPSKVNISNAYVTVCFADVPMVYVAPAADLNRGRYINFGNICQNAIVFNNVLYAVSNGKVAVTYVSGGAVSETNVSATDIATNGSAIYVYDGGNISAYSYGLSHLTFNINTAGKGLYVGNAVATGKKIFDISNSSLLAELDSKIIAFRGNTVITEKGVYDLSIKEYVGTTGIISTDVAAISGNNDVVSMGDGYMTFNSCLGDDEIVTAPTVGGIEAYSVYSEEVRITYDHGIGYLDGEEFASGSTVKGVGSHIFLLSLPCGRNVSVPFTVEAKLSGIEFLSGERTMSIGEKVTLRIKYLPDGASSIPVGFTCDKEGLLISDSGEVTALAVGKYNVTATAATEYGNFTATTEITVRDDLIAFDQESGFIIDRNNSQILGIPAGTSASQLLTQTTNEKTVNITDKSGKAISGIIGTGAKVTLLNDQGEFTDELFAVIRGDTDGDGYISAYDLYILEAVLRGESYSPEFVSAADADGNGVISDNDYRALKRILFGRANIQSGITELNPFGDCTVQTVSAPMNDDIIDVAVCISGCKYTKGVFGNINYSQGLEFVGAESAGWEIDSYDFGDSVGFFAFPENGEQCGTAFMVLINLRFRVIAQPKEKIAFTSEGLFVTFSKDCKIVEFQNSEIDVSPKVYDKFSITFNNAENFVFDIGKRIYTATIPHNSAIADISVVYGIDENVEITSTVIPNSGTGDVVVTYTDKNGNTELYTITVKRSAAPKIDTNCKLQSLEIEGHRLSPTFDPDYYNYEITVPFGTEKVNLYCVAQNSTAEIVIGDTALKGKKTVIPVTVITADGESLVYTVTVTTLPLEEPTVSTPDEIQGDDNGFMGWLIGSGVLAIVIILAIIVKKKKEKTDE